jgi:hypothetical protein
MLGVLCKSSAIWTALATKTNSGARKIALHLVTSSPSGIPCRHQKHRDADRLIGTQRATMLVYFGRVSVIDQRIDMQPCTVRCIAAYGRQLVTESFAFPHFNPGNSP